MKYPIVVVAGVLGCVLFFAFSPATRADDAEWWAMARKASCPELIEAYKTTSAAERKVAAAINSDRNATVATNVLGVATLSILGFGLFTWNDNASAEENLADLRNDLKIITTVAKEKNCELPAPGK